MAKSTLIKDAATRNAVSDLEKTVKRLEEIKQLPADATIQQVIATINKITNSLKRK